MWVYLGPLRLRWKFEPSGYIAGRQFRDVQISGPFRRWEHTHLFISEGPEACRLEGRIEYELPFGALGDFVAGWMVWRSLARVFECRHRVTAETMREKVKGTTDEHR
jgi:ligand-binding SRPBCC domain-containing protein